MTRRKGLVLDANILLRAVFGVRVRLDKISTLERVLVGFGSKKKNQEFEAMMRRAGKEWFKGGKFVFE